MRFAIFILLLSSGFVFGQRNLRDSSINTLIIGINYKLDFPAGDFADTWGLHSSIGLDANYKFKNNLTLGFNKGFLFGNTFLQPEIFDDLLTTEGTITNLNGLPANVLFLLRGWNSHINVGYVFNQLGNNPNSGLWINAGAGFLMHKIRIESIYDPLPQLQGDYAKGYDRLTYGFSTSQFIGYLFQADRRFLNFYAGFEFIQGFTQNRRAYNFDLGGPDNTSKFDFLYGLKVAWMVPIYKRAPKEFYID